MLLVPLTPLVEPVEATGARSQPCGGSICINEVMPNPNGYDDAAWPNGEWLELHNSGTSSVDIETGISQQSIKDALPQFRFYRWL